MNQMTNSTIVSSVLVIALCISSTAAFGRPPRTRQEQGVIQSMDYERQTFILIRSGQSEPVALTWNERTTFVQDGRAVSPATIANGAAVSVSYRSPFFGKPFATKVVWETVLSEIDPKTDAAGVPGKTATTSKNQKQ